MSLPIEPSSIQVTMPEKKYLRENPLFKEVQKSTDFVKAVYYEPKEPLYFMTQVSFQKTEFHEIDTEVKESKSQLYLFGFLPIASIVRTKYMKEKITRISHFCTLTPEMLAWVESVKPSCQEILRNRGKLNFKPTDEEINLKTPICVYPFLVEYSGMTGIGWKRYQLPEESLPV